MSQGNGSIASDLKQAEPSSESPEVSTGGQTSVLSAEDGGSVSLEGVEEKKGAPHAANTQSGTEFKTQSSDAEKTGGETGSASRQRHAGDSGSGYGGTEEKNSKDDFSEPVDKGGLLPPYDEEAKSGSRDGSSLSEHPVNDQCNDIGGNASNPTVPESANEGTHGETSSGNDVMGLPVSGITSVGISGVDEDRRSEPTNIENDASGQAQDGSAYVDKSNESWTDVVKLEDGHHSAGNVPFFLDFKSYTGDGSGTEEEQAIFMKELESFHKERSPEFKPPKFYGEGLNCLKLWRAVIKLGGYGRVTSCKLWRQVGESFNPPKTCTTISWSFRSFYEKALLEYEKKKMLSGELQLLSCCAENQAFNLTSVGKSRRDSASQSVQCWRTQHFHGKSDDNDPKSKERSPSSLLNHDRHLRNIGGFKRKAASSVQHSIKHPRKELSKSQMDAEVVDVGAPADWVKINVIRTKECFEVYALVPGLLCEEVNVQSDAAGQVVISGDPEQPDNPWGVTSFKKIVTLPSRIDPYQTSAVVTLHGQLVVRAPFERKAGLF